MTESDLIEQLVERLGQPIVPLEDQLWDTSDVARYFRRSPGYVLDTLSRQASFPRAIRLPSNTKSRPLYNAGEVVCWAKRFREKH